MKFEAVKKAQIDKAFEFALFAAQEQIRTDCNKYVRVDQGILRDSISTQASGDKLTVSWDTPYAKRVYYTGNPSHNVNVFASLRWAEKAESLHGATWKRILEKGMASHL